jgi:formylglycine-generating enzyme required for sulfatase activity
VNYVNLYSSMRFANWMSNGQGHGDTETGAYTLTGGTPLVPLNSLLVRRNPDAKVFLPSEDEWYKAAYYDPARHRYWDYPAGSDTPTRCTLPTQARGAANCGLVTAAANPANPGITGVASWFWGDVTDVDAYPGSVSPYGAYDMGGNLFQWTEELTVSVLGQYHAGAKVAPVLDAVFGVLGNPFQVNGFGPCAVVRGTDYGDGAEFGGANGRTCDIAADPFETYGIRLAARAG